MSNLESITVSLDTARKLNASGWQDSEGWYWCQVGSPEWRLLYWGKNGLIDFDNHEVINHGMLISAIKAPTAQELLEELPRGISIMDMNYESGTCVWQVEHKDLEGVIHTPMPSDNLVEALSNMWLYLQGNNLLPST